MNLDKALDSTAPRWQIQPCDDALAARIGRQASLDFAQSAFESCQIAGHVSNRFRIANGAIRDTDIFGCHSLGPGFGRDSSTTAKAFQ